MKEHKCFVCDTLYFSDEPGYWGYCSEACKNHSYLLDEADEKKEVAK